MTEEQDQSARAAFAQGDFTTAEHLFGLVAQSDPDNALAQYNWGVALGKLDRLEEALARYRRTIELNPHFTDAYINFGAGLNELGLIRQARQGFALARQVNPDHPIPILNEGISALALGDYAQGWRDFSARWRLPAYAKFKRDFEKPYWTGQDVAGKTLFLFAEQGFGDSIQIARYADLIKARGAEVIIETPPALTTLLKSLKSRPTIIPQHTEIPDFDYYCAMMDVPGAFGTLIETIPTNVPYLFAETAQIEKYQHLPRKKPKRVGLSWAGRQTHENDHNRSLSFSQLSPLLNHQEIDWVSVQRVVSDHDAPQLKMSGAEDWGKNFVDFADAAAALMSLDLVITVDTAIAHLAGSLDKPVWILLPFYADWRWLTERTDSPWYPSARLFRQKKRRDWETVLLEVAALL